jgi:hypothetical protein
MAGVQWFQSALFAALRSFLDKFRDRFRAALAAATATASGADKGALAAYGTEGDHNGVNVGTQLGYGAGTVLNQDDTISVNFGKEVSGNDLAVTIA